MFTATKILNRHKFITKKYMIHNKYPKTIESTPIIRDISSLRDISNEKWNTPLDGPKLKYLDDVHLKPFDASYMVNFETYTEHSTY